jgi:hypothetical protein
VRKLRSSYALRMEQSYGDELSLVSAVKVSYRLVPHDRGAKKSSKQVPIPVSFAAYCEVCPPL